MCQLQPLAGGQGGEIGGRDAISKRRTALDGVNWENFVSDQLSLSPQTPNVSILIGNRRDENCFAFYFLMNV